MDSPGIVVLHLPVGGCQIGAMRNHPEEVSSLLDLPPHVFAVFGMCVGYPNPNSAAVKPRLPQLSVLHRETYKLENQDDAIADYNEVMKAFYAEQQMNIPGDWSEHFKPAGCYPSIIVWARSPT